MANFANSVVPTALYKLQGMMLQPEFKAPPSKVLMAFMKNRNFLIPATEYERLLATKESDQQAVAIKTINKQTISIGSARAAAHTGNVGDSSSLTPTFTTYAAPFKYSVKRGDRNLFKTAEVVASQIRSAVIDLHASIDTALESWLDTYKSQVKVPTTPISGIWDAANYILQILNADSDLVFQRAKGWMRENYYDGMFDALLDEYLYQRYQFLTRQGGGNATNLGWQSEGLDAGVTARLTPDAGYLGMGYIFPTGTIGAIDWIPRLNREGYGEVLQVGGRYSSLRDPLGSGITFAVHEYGTAADNESNGAETQDIDIQVEISVDIAPVKAPMSTANAAPIFKFGLLAS